MDYKKINTGNAIQALQQIAKEAEDIIVNDGTPEDRKEFIERLANITITKRNRRTKAQLLYDSEQKNG